MARMGWRSARQTDRGFRSRELPDGRWVEWTEIRGTGTPRVTLGFLDGRAIDDATLHELIGLRRSA